MVLPFSDLDSPIVVTSWGKQLSVESADDPSIAAFLDELRPRMRPNLEFHAPVVRARHSEAWATIPCDRRVHDSRWLWPSA